MAEINKIQFKRGSNLDNAGTPSAGEPIYDTSTGKLYIGDGTLAPGGTGINTLKAISDDKLPLTGGHLTGDLNVTADGARLFVNSADHELVSIGRAGSSGSALDQGYLRMKSGGANKIALHTAGDSYIAGGSLGIGTTSPATATNVLLTVGDTSLGYAGMEIRGGTNAESWRLYSSFDGNNDAIFGLYRVADSSYKFKVGESGNASFAGAITQDSGTFTIKNASGDSNGLRIFQDSSDASKIYNHYNGTLQLGVGNTTAITIDSSEKSTLAGELRVDGGQASIYGLSGGGDAILELNANNANDNDDRWQVYIDTSANSMFKVRNYATGSWVDRLRMDGANFYLDNVGNIEASRSSDPGLKLISSESNTDDWHMYVAGSGLKFRNLTDSNTAFELTHANNAVFSGDVTVDSLNITNDATITSTAKYFQVRSNADNSLITKHGYDGIYTTGSQHQYISSAQDIKFYPGGTNKVTFASGGLVSLTGSLTTTGSTITVDPSSGDASLLLQGAAGAQTVRIDQNSIRTTTNSALSIFTNNNGSQGLSISNGGAITFNGAFTFPTSIGTAGQVLKVPSSGTTLEWGAGGGGSSTFTEQVNIETSTANSLVLKDTNSTGTATTSYVQFIDSSDAQQGYVGQGSSGNGNTFLYSNSGSPILGSANASAPQYYNGNAGTYHTIWHAGNDGSSSGLDADLLDGQHGSYYQPASSAITTSNIGSQSVASATNADTVDNLHASSFIRSDATAIKTGGSALQFQPSSGSAKTNMDARVSGSGARLHKWNNSGSGYLAYYENWYDGSNYGSFGHDGAKWVFNQQIKVADAYGDAYFGGNQSDEWGRIEFNGFGNGVYLYTDNGGFKFDSPVYPYGDGTEALGSASLRWNLIYGNQYYAWDWFRAKGSTGLYFQDYGGGWHMTDSTWIRSYGSKYVYIDNLLSANTLNVATSGGITPTQHDNTPLVGSKTNNVARFNGSIHLDGNNDSISFGSGTATFLHDEELGFGWGGGIYMTDGDWVRIRNSKNVYASSGHFRGGRFSDGSSGSYYVEPNSSSAIKLNTPSGYVQIGPMNSSYCHYNTDRAIHWFNVKLEIQGDCNPHIANSYALGSESKRWQNLYINNIAKVGQLKLNNSFVLRQGSNDYGEFTSWLQGSGGHGVYFPSTSDSAAPHFMPNNAYASYGTFRITNGNGGYPGIIMGTHSNKPTFMVADSTSSGGLYYSGTGRWAYYHNYGHNCLGIGSSTTSSSYHLYVHGSVYTTGSYSSSDIRLKENVETINNSLNKVMNMRGVYFDWINKEKGEGRQTGVIAQEMKEVLPEAVVYAEDVDEYSVDYTKITGVLIEAIKDLKNEINELKKGCCNGSTEIN